MSGRVANTIRTTKILRILMDHNATVNGSVVRLRPTINPRGKSKPLISWKPTLAFEI